MAEMTVLFAGVLMFLVLDPIRNIPLFAAALGEVPAARRRRVVLRESVMALAILLIFLAGGDGMLSHVGRPLVTLCAGAVLFLMALQTVSAHALDPEEEEPSGEPFLIPLAIPYLAGPAAIAAVVVLVNDAPERTLDWLIAIAAAWLATTILLVFATELSRTLGKRGLRLATRVMAMLLTLVAAQITLEGLRQMLVMAQISG